jgi:hypothetical protein
MLMPSNHSSRSIATCLLQKPITETRRKKWTPGQFARHLCQVLRGRRDGLDGAGDRLQPLPGLTEAAELERLAHDRPLLGAPAHHGLVQLQELVPRVDGVADLNTKNDKYVRMYSRQMCRMTCNCGLEHIIVIWKW